MIKCRPLPRLGAALKGAIVTGNPLRAVDLHVHTVRSSFRHLQSLRSRDSCNDDGR